MTVEGMMLHFAQVMGDGGNEKVERITFVLPLRWYSSSPLTNSSVHVDSLLAGFWQCTGYGVRLIIYGYSLQPCLRAP
jgi:hypothetical protein